MADWTDGPEYAPAERPAAFVEPDAASLTAAPEEPAAPAPEAAAHRGVRPEFGPVDAPALADLAAPSGPDRDPREAFDVASTPMTSWTSAPAQLPQSAEPAAPVLPPPAAFPPPTAPAAPPAWTPQQAFPPAAPPPVSHVPGPYAGPPPSVNPQGFPPPGPPPWQQPPPASTPAPVSVRDMAAAATPGVLICLALGALITPLSIPLLVVAFTLAARIRYRRRAVRRAFSSTLYAAIGLGLLWSMLGGGVIADLYLWDSIAGWARWGCLVLFVVIPLIVGDALRRGERPEDLP